MRMNPPRGMGGMGPQVEFQTQKEILVIQDKTSMALQRITIWNIILHPISTVQPPCSHFQYSDCHFMSKPNVWLPFIKGFHKNSYNVKPTAYKQCADDSPPLLKRNFGWDSLIILPLNVRSILILCLALTRSHPLVMPVLQLQSILTPTYRDRGKTLRLL